MSETTPDQMQAPPGVKVEKMEYRRRRGRDEFVVLLEDKTELVLDAELVVKHGVAAGQALSAAAVDLVRSEQEKLEARRRLLAHLLRRKKTRVESRRYLLQLKFPEHAVDAAVEAAAALGYINDAAYADAFTRMQVRQQKGPRAVREELRQRGIERPLADEATSANYPVETQRELALAAAQKYLRRLGETEPQAVQQKLFQFLMRRGFDTDIISDICREISSGGGDD